MKSAIKNQHKKCMFFNLLMAILLLSGCTTLESTKRLTQGAIAQSNQQPIDWSTILTPPPSDGSPEQIKDVETVESFNAAASPERILQAISDNDVDIFKAYKSVLGENFTNKNYTKLDELMHYSLAYSGLETRSAKSIYSRNRPFVNNKKIKICIEKAPNGSSYPSGHASWGALSSAILSQIFTDDKIKILERGADYANSRIYCGVHYPSDILAGRTTAFVILGRLSSDKKFIKLFKAAQTEAQKANFTKSH